MDIDAEQHHEAEQHPLGELLCWLERLEARQRGIEASRLRLIAAAVDQACAVRPRAVQASGPGHGTARSRELAYRSLRAELALALGLGERQIESQMDLAVSLSRDYSAVLDAVEEGGIAVAHARVIVDAGVVIGVGNEPGSVRRRREYERAVLAAALRETPNRLRPIARRLAENSAELALEERHREARTHRRVAVSECEDGMADLTAHLPAVEAYAIADRLTRIARAAERGERVVRGVGAGDDESGDRRTRDQLRADVFAELLLGADECALFAGSAAEAIRAQVQVIASRDGSELAGYGPICSRTADEYAARAPGWDRVLAADAGFGSGTDTSLPGGEVLYVDRYRPNEAMRRLLGARDRHCRFPGCRVPLNRCDIDHTVDAALGGETSSENLAHLCRGHHTLKHHSDWRVRQSGGGDLTWTSPMGRAYRDRAQRRVGFTAVPTGRPQAQTQAQAHAQVWAQAQPQVAQALSPPDEAQF